jgi:protein tyrosine/serine phosphatase
MSRYKEYTRSGTAGFVKAYHDIMISGSNAYSRVFRHLAQPKSSPVLVHCTAGKDRTGVLVALLFLLAGAQEDEIAKEYSLTDLGLAELKPLFTERLLKNPALEGNAEGVSNMVSSKPENMYATIGMIKDKFGSAEEYMRTHCGLTEEEVRLLRKNITEGALASM